MSSVPLWGSYNASVCSKNMTMALSVYFFQGSYSWLYSSGNILTTHVCGIETRRFGRLYKTTYSLVLLNNFKKATGPFHLQLSILKRPFFFFNLVSVIYSGKAELYRLTRLSYNTIRVFNESITAIIFMSKQKCLFKCNI